MAFTSALQATPSLPAGVFRPACAPKRLAAGCSRQAGPLARRAVVTGAGRSRELLEALQTDGKIVKDRPDVESDVRYARCDSSALFQWQARRHFAANIARGEPGMRLLEAALQVVAEDDAIASHSTVCFPVQAYLDRVDRIVDDIVARGLLAPYQQQGQQGQQQQGQQQQQVEAGAAGPGPGSAALAAAAEAAAGTSGQGLEQRQLDAVRAVERHLFDDVGFKAGPASGRSGVPPRSVVDHPGVWEDARLAYLNEVLVRRRGLPAALAIVFADVMQRLLLRGQLDFAVAMDTRGFTSLPRGVPLPGFSRDVLVRRQGRKGGALPGPQAPAGQGQEEEERGQEEESEEQGEPEEEVVVLNTCTSDALAELLRHLKRTYWPFQWDSSVDAYEAGGGNSHGGFRAAAKAAVTAEMSAAIRAVSIVANWRLERGIWTSPGAGDIRRCRAACERLVMLLGDDAPEERRDLAVILFHIGDLGAARAELRAYMHTRSYKSTLQGDPLDKVLCQKMAVLLDTIEGLQEPERVTSVQAWLEADGPPGEGAERKPLTW